MKGDTGAVGVEEYGRDLMEVILGHPFSDMTTPELIEEAVAEVMHAIHELSNNDTNGALGAPEYRGLLIGDYLDGLDLSGATAAPGGNSPQAWSNTYKNNRIVLSGFNTYKGSGYNEIKKNHVLFTFRNCITQGYMNSTNTNAGGYNASALRVWLEGAAGDGSGAFATRLKAAIGENYLYTINLNRSRKGSQDWTNFTVWPPTELEAFGYPTHGDEGVYMQSISGGPTARAGNNCNVFLPVYQNSFVYQTKRFNGARTPWWSMTPAGTNSTDFCCGAANTHASRNSASVVMGISPVFGVC
jgi:hypothetical protein